MGWPILKIGVTNQVPRRRVKFLYLSQNSIGLQFNPVFAKNGFKQNVFVNNGSTWGPIKIWLKHKNLSRLLGTCLGTRIFKIGPPVQKLHLVTFFCHIAFFDLWVCINRAERDLAENVTFDWVDRFWKLKCLNRC